MRGACMAVALAFGLAACGDDGESADTSADVGADTIDDATADVGDDTTSDALDDATTDASDGVDSATASDADASDADTTPEPPWYENAIMYEVFVRSFQDSDGDGIGDLQGLISRLDYLNDGVPGAGDDLEVDGLWLMPVFASDSYHGYDTTDYTTVDSDYGTNADLEALAAACKARGMHLVLDLVMNHTGEHHPWFVDAASSPASAHRDWYVWRADDPGWTQPFGAHDHVWHPSGGAFYYGIFWSGMPDLNYRTPAVVAEMTDVARLWLGRGVDGFRLDAARYLIESSDGKLAEQPETHAFWKSFRADLADDDVAGGRDDLYLVGEVWTTRADVASYYGGGAELHQCFDFDLATGIELALTRGAASWLTSVLSQQKSSAAPWSFSATFLTNHDLDRLTRRLPAGALGAAATLLLTLPGTPYIYYGDELGVLSAPGLGDLAKRGPMAWTADAKAGFTTGTPWLGLAAESDTRNVATQSADEASLLSQYKRLIRLRRAHPALSGANVKSVAVADGGLFTMLRWTDDEVLLVAVNLQNAERAETTLDLSADAALLGDGPWTLTALLGPAQNLDASQLSAIPTGQPFAPFESRMFRLR